MKKKENYNQVKLSDSQKEKLKEEIRAFYLDQQGEEPGIIKQLRLLDLFVEKLAPVVYNKALDDARQWYCVMMDHMDSDFYALYKNEM